MKANRLIWLFSLLFSLIIVISGCKLGKESKSSSTTPGKTEIPVISLTSIAVTSANSSLTQGKTKQFTATATYSDNSTQDITGTASWTSSGNEVATIAVGGLATIKAPGTTLIRATLDGVTSTAQSLTISLSSTILMGKVPIPSTVQVGNAFDAAVTAVKNAVADFSFVPGEGMASVKPWLVVGEVNMSFTAGRYGRLLEVCAPMFADDAMSMGQHHALGMPCKIGVWTEDTNGDNVDDMVKINTLDESVIFGFFFADVLSAPGFNDFAAMIKNQTKEIVQAAVTNLNGEWLYEHQPPFYTQTELAAVQSWTANGGYTGDAGYGLKVEIPFAGNKDEGQSAAAFLTEVKGKIMAAIGHTPYSRDDWHVVEENFNMPVGDYTKEDNPFARIGEIKVCSPYYAKQVVGLGGKYIVTLPCDISVWLNDLTMDSQGMPAYKTPDTVVVSILNPEFILKNYFKDVPANIQAQMAGMGPEIKNQVLAMVNQGLKDYSYPNPQRPRFSTNILSGKVPIPNTAQVGDAFNAAVTAVKNAVAGYSFVPGEGMDPINPWLVVGEVAMPFATAGRYGKLLEVCAPMFADDAMAMGQHHSLGMPCKIGIWTEDTNGDNVDDVVKINTLDESVIFSFFFADVMGAPGFDDFASMIKNQMKDIVKTAITNLNGEWIFEHQPPFFTQTELADVQSWKDDGGYAGEKGYGIRVEIPLAWNKPEGQSAVDFLSEIKGKIMAAIGHTPDARPDWHVVEEDFNIHVGDFTKTDNPFARIGEIKVCSPYYAGQVVGLGGKYIVAMPCDISVWLNDLTMGSDGMPAYKTPDTVIVGILNPEFILKNYFKDVPANIQAQMAGMGPEIKNELLAMVHHALDEPLYRCIWESQFEKVAGLARAYTAELKAETKKPVIEAATLYANINNGCDVDNPFILSVRKPDDYALGHIPEAINISWRSIADDASLAQFPTNGKQLVTYCYTGHTGQVAATVLNILGYNAVNLKYGICSWTQDATIRATTPFRDEDSNDFTTETTINHLGPSYDPPILAFDAETPQEIARLAARAYLSDTSPSRGPMITAQALHTLITDRNDQDELNLSNDPLIISVCSPADYAIGHIPGAYNIPFKNIADYQYLSKLPTNRQIVTYCYTGHTGQLAATILNVLGYKAANLRYGIMSWTRDAVVRVFPPFTEGTDSPTPPDYETHSDATP